MTAPDTPRWRRWIVPRGVSAWLTTLSIAWFTAGLTALIAAELYYGWRAAPIRHVGHAAAYLALAGWCWFGRLLHEPRRRRERKL